MRNVICFELRKGDMVEAEMPMPIGSYVKLISQRAGEVAKNKGVSLGYRFYWDMIMERLVLYRRHSECKRGLLLAEKHQPIEYKYNSQNEKEYFFMQDAHDSITSV